MGALAKLRKVTISFIMFVFLSVYLSVYPSIRMQQLSFNWTDFHETFYFVFFEKMFWEDSNFIKMQPVKAGTLHEDLRPFITISW